METSSTRARNINSQSGTRRSCASSFPSEPVLMPQPRQLKFLCQNRLRPALLHSKPLHMRAYHVQSELHPAPTLGTNRPDPDSHMGVKCSPPRRRWPQKKQGTCSGAELYRHAQL